MLDAIVEINNLQEIHDAPHPAISTPTPQPSAPPIAESVLATFDAESDEGGGAGIST